MTTETKFKAQPASLRLAIILVIFLMLVGIAVGVNRIFPSVAVRDVLLAMALWRVIVLTLKVDD